MFNKYNWGRLDEVMKLHSLYFIVADVIFWIYCIWHHTWNAVPFFWFLNVIFKFSGYPGAFWISRGQGNSGRASMNLFHLLKYVSCIPSSSLYLSCFDISDHPQSLSFLFSLLPYFHCSSSNFLSLLLRVLILIILFGRVVHSAQPC